MAWTSRGVIGSGIYSVVSHNHSGVYLPIAGVAASATKLATARTIDITGDITATAVAFNGTANIAISAAVNNDSHTHGTQYLSLGGGTLTGTVVARTIYPVTDLAYDLGTSTRAWRNLYVDSIYDEDGTRRIQLQGSPGTLFYNDSGLLAASAGGTATPNFAIENKFYISSSITNTGSTGYLGLVYNGTTYEVYRFTSKRAYKKNIRSLPSDYSEGLYKLKPRLFDMRSAHSTGEEWADKDQPGFIADEVFDAFGRSAAPLDEDGEPSGWSDKFVTVMLVAEVQKLRRELTALQRG